MSTDISNQVAALTAILERMEKRLDEDRQERKAESEKIDKALAHDRANSAMTRSAVSAELTDIRHGQDDLLRRLDKIEPVTDALTSLKAKVSGVVMTITVIGGIAWGGIVFFKEFIMELFR